MLWIVYVNGMSEEVLSIFNNVEVLLLIY